MRQILECVDSAIKIARSFLMKLATILIDGNYFRSIGFRDELELLQKMRHPNVVQFLGAITQSTPMMIVTEFMPQVAPPLLPCCCKDGG